MGVWRMGDRGKDPPLHNPRGKGFERGRRGGGGVEGSVYIVLQTEVLGW